MTAGIAGFVGMVGLTTGLVVGEVGGLVKIGDIIVVIGVVEVAGLVVEGDDGEVQDDSISMEHIDKDKNSSSLDGLCICFLIFYYL